MSSSRTTRREFARAVIAAAAAPVLASACARAEAPAPAAPPAPATPPPDAARPADAEPEVDALTEIVRARYGSRLTPEQLREVRESIRGNVSAAKQLREFELPITTEPAFVFTPYRGEG